MGNTATFTVTSPSAGLSYQWQRDGVNIPGATSASYTTPAVFLGDEAAYRVIVANCAGSVTSDPATLTITPIIGVSFDFNSPGQFTNAPYSMVYNDWLNSSFNTPNTIFESPIGGVGPFPGSGSLDLAPSTGTGAATVNTAILLPTPFDFSLPGKTLFASTMLKIKTPFRNAADRNTQLGFCTSTNTDLNNNAGFSYMTVILNKQTTATSPTFSLRQGHKLNAANSFAEGNAAADGVLTVSNWYKITAKFQNLGGGTFSVESALVDMGPDGTTPGATVQTVGPATLTNPDITAARYLWFVLRGIENTGVEARDNTYVYTTSGDVHFVDHPVDQALLPGRRAVFKAMVDGTGPYTYQWYRNDRPIPGGTGWKYITPPVSADDNGTSYYVEVSNGTSIDYSAPAWLTVLEDPLAVVSAGSVDGSTVGVEFNQPVDPVTAANPANYTINGTAAVAARVYRTGLGAMGADGIYVVLTPATLLTANFTLSVNGVQDLSGNAIGANSTAGYFAGLMSADVNPATGPAGEDYCFGPGKFIVTGGGADIWGVSDMTHYVYSMRTGDFDVKTRLPYLDVVRGPTKAGFHVRRSLDPFDQMVSALLNPMWPGRDYPEGSRRDAPNIAAVSWGSTPNYSLAWYPNAWLRLRRAGNTFMRYTSTDGVNWQYDGQTTLALPETIHLGLAVCSVANMNMANAQFESVGEFGGYPGAVIAIVSQPTNFTVNANSSFTDGIVATVSGGGVPSGGELAFIWQRNDGSGNWVNLPTAGNTGTTPDTLLTNTMSIGPLLITDNGAQFRCVLRAPGAADVISDVFTATVADTAAPTFSSAGIFPLNGYSANQVILNFNEALSAATALDKANYTVTNAAGVAFTINSASFLGDDPRTVVLTVDGNLGLGANFGVRVTGVTDLNNNTVAATTRLFRSFDPPTAPVVCEVYQDIGGGNAVQLLMVTNLFTNAQPTWIVYSNLFAFNAGLAATTVPTYPNTSTIAYDQYGVKVYTCFVPPSSGAYKFWIRSDDGMALFMNTNGATAPVPPIVTPVTAPGNPQEAAQFAFDKNPNTKFYTGTSADAQFIVTPASGPTVVKSIYFRAANDSNARDPLTYTLEGSTAGVGGPWTVIASGATGLATDPGRYLPGLVQNFANTTAYTSYRITMNTTRGGSSGTQISEVYLLDASGADVTMPNWVLCAANTANNGNYSVGTVPATGTTNIYLQGGKPYYMMFLGKEGSGGDGFSVAHTAPTVTTAPSTTTYISAANLAYPSAAAPAPKAVTELYTSFNNFLTGYNLLAGLTAATNFPTDNYQVNIANFSYIAGLPTVVGYQPYFATQPDLYHTRVDNYLGRMISYFVPPSNGLYRFFMRSDDASQLYMNTNAVNSTDPAGKTLLGRLDAYTGAYTMVAQGVSLVGGQKYYLEVLWREGGGGDGVAVAVRAQSDGGTPPTSPKCEVIPGSMLEFPTEFARAGAVNFNYIASSSPQSPDKSTVTISDGQSLVLCAAGLTGTMPYGGYLWTKNGQPILANSFTNFTAPFTLADNGSVIALTVTNQIGSVTRTLTVNVLADTTAPVVTRCVGWRDADGFSLEFNEPLDEITATFLGNYHVNNGLAIVSATLDSTRRIVSLATTPQAPNTTYTVAINGVRDLSSGGNPVNATAAFSTWTVGGSGSFLVEIWTNIPNGAIVDLTGQPKFQANLPDVVYYTNVFGVGPYGANSGLENYGARVSGYFIPPSTAPYRFYCRSDDASQIWMNINSADSQNPAGRTMLTHMPSANQSMATPLAQSVPVPLNAGQRYYIEGLLKEGTGGDYLLVAFAQCDANGTALSGTPADAAASIATAASFDGTPGNPDSYIITGVPPAALTVGENEPVSLALTVGMPTDRQTIFISQWAKADPGSSTFVDLPGMNNKLSLAFLAKLADDGARYRLTVSAPGLNKQYITALTVIPDPVPAEVPIVSANSLDGRSMVIQYAKAIAPEIATDQWNYVLNGFDALQVLSAAMVDDRTVSFVLDPASYQPGPTFTIEAPYITPPGAPPVMGYVEYLTAMDIGTAGDPMVVGSTITATNKSFTMKAGGSDVWGTADHMQMAYRSVIGDFDIKVRVESDLGPGAWSKAGLMVRRTTDANARNMFLAVTPPAYQRPTVGSDRYQFAWRDTDGASSAWASEAAIQPAYPNAWIRLQRVGSVINAYWGNNGVDWTLYATRDTAVFGGSYPETMLVGMFLDAGNNGDPVGATAEFRDLDFPPIPVITVQPTPAEQTVALDTPVTFTVEATGAGTLTYQWRRNGAAIPGATSATLTIPAAQVADSGVYTVLVANNGGGTVSDACALTVNNGLPTVTAFTTNAIQNVGLTFPAVDLVAPGVASDPEGKPLSVVAVSGVAPVTYAANFDDGLPPAGASLYSVAGGGYVSPNGGAGDSGCLKLTDAVASQAGALVINELTPGKRVSAFRASFKLYVAAGTAELADGFNFSFGGDLPSAAGSGYGENGAGTGFSFVLDNYRFAPFYWGTPIGSPGGGTANTAGLKVQYKGVILAGVQIPVWNATRFVPVSIDVTPEGVATVIVDGTNVFGNVTLPGFAPTVGRFGLYARTGGSTQFQWVDDLSITAMTSDTAHGYSNLGGGLFGNTYVNPTGGVGNSGNLHLTDNVNSQSGSFVLDPLAPGVGIQAFTASFKLRIGNGTGNAADGFSFNLASDLPDAATGGTAAEEGIGTGLSVTVDNYPTGGTDSPSFKLKWGGALLGFIKIPKWNSPNWVPISLTMDADGTLDVVVDGTNVVSNLQTPYQPVVGRFGFFARTGGENETHWLDDIAITAMTTLGYPAYYSQDFNSGGPGAVSLVGGVVNYTPPPNGCGTDKFYYVVSDGQLYGQVVNEVTVNILEATPAPPVVTAYAANAVALAVTTCEAAVPDLSKSVQATDNCCCLSVTQTPAAGTMLGVGAYELVYTVTDTMGLSTSVTGVLAVVDMQPPTMACPSARTLEADPFQAFITTIPDFVTGLTVADNCGLASVTQDPAAGTPVGPGLYNVAILATDVHGNTNLCVVPVTVVETSLYAKSILAQGPLAYWRFNDSVSSPVLDLAQNLGSLGAAGNGAYTAPHGVPGALPGNPAATAARFDGTSAQSVTVPFNAGLNPAAPFSVEGWFKPAWAVPPSGQSSLAAAISSVHIADPRSGWLIYQSVDGWNVRFYNQAGTATSLSITGGGAPDTNTWYHLALTYDGTTATLYVNGVSAASGAPTGYVPNPDGAFTIGARSDTGFPWAGDADEVACYTTALSEAQVQAHYAARTGTAYQAAVLADSPVGYWPLDEAAYVPPVAVNSGTLGAAANGSYWNGAYNVAGAAYPGMIGLETFNTAVSLDGVNDYVGTALSLTALPGVYTFSGWIRRAPVVQNGRTGLFGQNDLVEFGYIDDNTLHAWTDGGLNVTPNPFPNETWSHVAVVSDGPTISFYTNGLFAGSRAHTPDTRGTNAFKFMIGGGGIFDASGNYFNGQIDEVAVFDKALSPMAIANQYFSGVATAPVFTKALTDTTNYVGDTVTLSVEAVGTPPLAYEWSYYGTPVEGASGPTLVIPNVTIEAGSYECRVYNAVGDATSTAELYVLEEAPTIVQQPVPVTVYSGFTARFSVTARGGDHVTYQWKKGETEITGATGATLVLSPVSLADLGAYKVVVSNPSGPTESDAADLVVLLPAVGSVEYSMIALNPVSLWRCNEPASPAYDYVGFRHANAVGGASFGMAGPQQSQAYPGFEADNKAVQYNGTDAGLSATGVSPVNSVGAFTMMGWISLTAAPGGRVSLWGQNDVLEFGFHNAGVIGMWSPTGGFIENAFPFALNQWYFIATTGDGTTMTIYVNGKPIVSGGGATGNYGSSGYPFNIGTAVLDDSGNFFPGLIDEVAVYNRALSANEICQVWSAATGEQELTITATTTAIPDVKPVGTPHDGVTAGAAWMASVADSAAVTRMGVMDFVATEGDQIVVPASTDFDSTTGTIMFWMKSAGNQGDGNEGAILFDRRTGPGDVIVLDNNGTIFLQAKNDGGVINRFNSVGTVNDDKWRHVAYVYDQSASGAISIYIDGVLDTTHANGAAWSWPVGQRIELGRSHDGWWRKFNGQMDDVRIYNRILTPAEIGQVKAAGDVVDSAAMKLWLSFDTAPAGISINWGCGTLEEATQFANPVQNTLWTPVPGAVPPYVTPVRGPAKFYRVRY